MIVRLTAGLIVAGAAIVVASIAFTMNASPGVPPEADRDRLVAINNRIDALGDKFRDAQTRGVVIDRLPGVYRNLLAERTRLLAEADYARGRRGRVAKRIQQVGVALMALGVLAYATTRIGTRRLRLTARGDTPVP